jgi:hypothetical protein
MVGMKLKMQHQVQPREIAPPQTGKVQLLQGEVQEEIQNFLRAVDSYPARVAKEPSVTFQQHLCSIYNDRRDRGPRRH